MKRKDKRPSFQFYPMDWQSDPALCSVSFSARGLWMSMLCLMFNGERRGYLAVNGKALSEEQIARMCNGTPDEVQRGLSELRNARVFSESADHVIFSRRMVSDEKIRKARAKGGGDGGNPNFQRGKPNPYYLRNEAEDKQKITFTHNQNITPSSSSSSSSSVVSNETTPPTPKGAKGGGGGEELWLSGQEPPEFRDAFKRWMKHIEEKAHRPSTSMQRDAFLKQCHELGNEVAIEAIDFSIRQGWKTINQPRQPNGQTGTSEPEREY